MKLNPKAYIPTMLVQGNVPVCESIDIIEYMDEHLNGKNKLMEGQPDLIKERYAKFRALHEAWDVEPYSFGSMSQKNWFIKQMAPAGFMRNSEHA